MFDWLLNGLKAIGGHAPVMGANGIMESPGTGIMGNKDLFAQYLAGAGADIAENGTLGKNFNAVTQQHIQNKNFRDMFTQILKQGGSFKSTPKGEISFTLPSIPGANPTGNPASGPVNPQSGAAPVQMDTTPSSPIPGVPSTTDPIGMMGNYLSGGGLPSNFPFQLDLSNISNNGLAGLTPELMMAVVNTKLNQAGMQAKSLVELNDMMYKNRMASVAEGQLPIEQANSETARLNAYRQLADEMRTSPIEVPGMGKLDLKEFNALPDKVKAYSYYVFDQRVNNRAPLTYDAWERQADDPTMVLYYNMSKKDPKFKQFLMEYQKAGSTTINMTPGEKKIDEAKVQRQIYFMGDDWKTDLSKYLNSPEAVEKIDDKAYVNGVWNAGEARVQRRIATREWIEKSITSGDRSGKILGTSQNGSTLTWKVQWKDGSTSEISYDFR